MYSEEQCYLRIVESYLNSANTDIRYIWFGIVAFVLAEFGLCSGLPLCRI